MKYTFIILSSILLFFGCKNNSQDSSPTNETETAIDENRESPIEEKTVNYLEYYVAVNSGLRMRKSPSLKGEKMDVVKYGEAIQVNTNDATPISPVSGFKGSMVAVKYGDQEGYMFDGFLTRVPPPSKDQTLKKYVRKLKIQGIKASQNEKFEEITSTQKLLLPLVNFQQAFLIAQRMGWIVGDFNLPNPTSPEKTFANHKDIKKTIIGTSMKAISETGTRYKYMIPLPVYDKEYQYFTIEFEKFEQNNWDLFRLELSKEYFHQITTIQREGALYQIIYSETGE